MVTEMSEGTQFKPGDVVQLKSGGPKMTVSAAESSATGKVQYICEWFDADLKRLSAIFTPPVLKLAAE
jgi:uncharacterized protein YodC (DUF2158 family)